MPGEFGPGPEEEADRRYSERIKLAHEAVAGAREDLRHSGDRLGANLTAEQKDLAEGMIAAARENISKAIESNDQKLAAMRLDSIAASPSQPETRAITTAGPSSGEIVTDAARTEAAAKLSLKDRWNHFLHGDGLMDSPQAHDPAATESQERRPSQVPPEPPTEVLPIQAEAPTEPLAVVAEAQPQAQPLPLGRDAMMFNDLLKGSTGRGVNDRHPSTTMEMMEQLQSHGIIPGSPDTSIEDTYQLNKRSEGWQKIFINAWEREKSAPLNPTHSRIDLYHVEGSPNAALSVLYNRNKKNQYELAAWSVLRTDKPAFEVVEVDKYDKDTKEIVKKTIYKPTDSLRKAMKNGHVEEAATTNRIKTEQPSYQLGIPPAPHQSLNNVAAAARERLVERGAGIPEWAVPVAEDDHRHDHDDHDEHDDHEGHGGHDDHEGHDEHEQQELHGDYGATQVHEKSVEAVTPRTTLVDLGETEDMPEEASVEPEPVEVPVVTVVGKQVLPAPIRTIEIEAATETGSKVIEPEAPKPEGAAEVRRKNRYGIESAVSSEKKPSSAEAEDSFIDDPDSGLLAVLDGMGGHANGRQASQAGAAKLAEVLKEDIGRDHAQEKLERAVRQAHEAISEEAAKNSRPPGGTTLAAFKMLEGGQEAGIAWVGDSRVYRMRSGKIDMVTLDDGEHNTTDPNETAEEVQARLASITSDADLDEYGKTNRSARKNFRERNTISGYLGGKKERDVRVNTKIIAVQPGDRFLLTSDGVHDNLTAQEIEHIWSKADSAEQASANILAAAKARSLDKSHRRAKPDDITAVAMFLGEGDKQSKPEIVPAAPAGDEADDVKPEVATAAERVESGPTMADVPVKPEKRDKKPVEYSVSGGSDGELSIFSNLVERVQSDKEKFKVPAKRGLLTEYQVRELAQRAKTREEVRSIEDELWGRDVKQHEGDPEKQIFTRDQGDRKTKGKHAAGRKLLEPLNKRRRELVYEKNAEMNKATREAIVDLDHDYEEGRKNIFEGSSRIPGNDTRVETYESTDDDVRLKANFNPAASENKMIRREPKTVSYPAETAPDKKTDQAGQPVSAASEPDDTPKPERDIDDINRDLDKLKEKANQEPGANKRENRQEKLERLKNTYEEQQAKEKALAEKGRIVSPAIETRDEDNIARQTQGNSESGPINSRRATAEQQSVGSGNGMIEVEPSGDAAAPIEAGQAVEKEADTAYLNEIRSIQNQKDVTEAEIERLFNKAVAAGYVDARTGQSTGGEMADTVSAEIRKLDERQTDEAAAAEKILMAIKDINNNPGLSAEERQQQTQRQLKLAIEKRLIGSGTGETLASQIFTQGMTELEIPVVDDGRVSYEEAARRIGLQNAIRDAQRSSGKRKKR